MGFWKPEPSGKKSHNRGQGEAITGILLTSPSLCPPAQLPDTRANKPLEDSSPQLLTDPSFFHGAPGTLSPLCPLQIPDLDNAYG